MKSRAFVLLAALAAGTPAAAQQPPAGQPPPGQPPPGQPSGSPRSGAPQSPAAFFEMLSKGRAALAAKDYVSAQGLLGEAVAMRPNEPEAHYLLGRAYGEDKKHQQAVNHLTETLKLSPGHTGAMIDLASIEANTGRFEEADKHYRQAIEAGPNPRAERGLASLLSKQGKSAEAIERLRALVASQPADVDSRFELGMALMQSGDCKSAAGEFRAALEGKPDHLGALFNLGNCLNRTGEKEEGARVLEKFKTTSDEDAARTDRKRRAYFLLLEADKHFESLDLGAAVKALGEAVKLNPDDARGHAMLGQALDEMGDGAGALAAYRRSAQIDPSDPVVLIETGRLIGKSGRFQEAVPFLKKAAEIDPKMPEPHLFLAAAYQRLGRSAEAAAEEALYRRLSQQPPPGGQVDRKP